MSNFDLFSDSDEELKRRRSLGDNQCSIQTSQSMGSDNDTNSAITTSKKRTKKINTNRNKSDIDNDSSDSDIDNIVDDEGDYIVLNSPKELADVCINSKLYYTNHKGERISPKYFKSYDVITKVLTLGIRTDDSKTYECDASRITNIHVKPNKIGGGIETHDTKLKDTIKIPIAEWDKIVPETVISYQRKDKKMVYKAKFNSFITNKTKGTRMSMTSTAGFNYILGPSYIETIYRHFTSKDKTLAQILQRLNTLEKKVVKLESQLSKK